MTKGKFIVLAAGGKNRELERYGIGIEHVNEFVVRLARPLLQKGHRLVFGGSLNRPDEDLTQNHHSERQEAFLMKFRSLKMTQK